MLLIQHAGVFRIKGRGTLVAGLFVKRATPIARIGDKVELRSGDRVICQTSIRGIEAFSGSPPPSGHDWIGILIDDTAIPIDEPEVSVWLVEARST